ncbi:hypothetical protein OG539_24510 [Actinacidiphila glaucinigra]|uniref:hypothetical protein n=1 Tax=Actinacidiphila glaucinigra TaxID=235986 RepID=UPI002DDA7130|nr:hypothetical protein [Actinacidiphila glaucinigra]WSD60753.1 hypothetical protein OIE69_18395 [Actinacidiphila glaucinigra]
MNSQSNVPFQGLQALPDGEAELPLVVHLRWEDLAALGREASRLAVRLQRPVSLDEAAGHHLRTRFGVSHAPDKDEHPKTEATRAVTAAVPSSAAPMAIAPGAAQQSGGAHAAPTHAAPAHTPAHTPTHASTHATAPTTAPASAHAATSVSGTGLTPGRRPEQPGRLAPLDGRNVVEQPTTAAG